jgi:hypothetical protein
LIGELHGLVVGEQMTKSETALKIGDRTAGGIIFQIDPEGTSGLVVTAENIGDYSDWREAHHLCQACREEGFIDWRLPSHPELFQVYSKLFKAEIGGLSTGEYWSSTPGYGPGVYRAQSLILPH